MTRRLIGLTLCLLLAGRSAAQISGKQVIDEVRIDQMLDTPLPMDAVVRDEAGRELRLGEFFGERPVVLALVYYECPMLCNQILNGMVATLKTMELSAGSEFDVVALSIDPRELPSLAEEKKQKYLESYGRRGSEAGWHFLTADQEAIDRVTRATGFHYVYDERTGLFAHASVLMVATSGGILARYFFGIEYPARDLTFALIEASKERIGTAVDRLLLMCYQYDPATGKYSLLVSTILKVGGVLTVLILGGFMAIMLRREKKEAAPSFRRETG